MAFLEVNDLLMDGELCTLFSKEDFKKCLLGEVLQPNKKNHSAGKSVNSEQADGLAALDSHSLSEDIKMLKEDIERSSLMNAIMFKWTYMINYQHGQNLVFLPMQSSSF